MGKISGDFCRNLIFRKLGPLGYRLAQVFQYPQKSSQKFFI